MSAPAHDPKVAFLFPGQGSQKVGMAGALRASDPALIERWLERAELQSGLPVAQLVNEGPAEALTATDVAQPALFAVSLAVVAVARELGLRPDAVAGHSLGEYTAAVVSGALDEEDGLELVCRRGQLMAAIQSERPGAMAAIIGLESEAVSELCARAADAGSVAPANLNSPTQVVVSGEEPGVLRLLELAQEAGARRAVRLQVGAAFHSTLMRPVQQELSETTRALTWHDPLTPLVANCSGEVLTTGSAIREALVTQIASPVLWVDCVRSLVAAGCSTYLELGPGRVLSGLVRQIAPEAEVVAADSRAALTAFAERHPWFVGPSERP